MVILFVRNTIHRDHQWYMEILEYLTKYFFAHYHQNYARSVPLYITTMQETEKKPPDIWAELIKGNFCVTKTVAGFTSITLDEGTKQETRTLNVIGGIVGITHNEKALANYFITAPELSKLLHEVAAEYGSDNNYKVTQHHEITGEKPSRMIQNARKLTDVVRECSP